MMKYIARLLTTAGLLLPLAAPMAAADNLILIQTNDTHSQIDPNDKNLGGIQRRKAVIDSIRAIHPDALLIDSGDAVQGSLFFTIYGGEVEMKMMNELGYDIAILGNHDFDNGVESLAKNLALSDARWITTNYDLSGTPLAPYFSPYTISEIDGKKIAFIGINLNPKGMIAEGNYDGVKYLDGIKAANATAWHLKHNEKVDLVVAVTHIGYDEVADLNDQELAEESEDIDIILGGHSHTVLRPGSGKEWVKNDQDREVLVTQNGKSGIFVTEVTVDLDSIGSKPPVYRQIAVDSRLDNTRSERIDSILAPYRAGVEEMMGRKIGESAVELDADKAPLLNFITDFALDRAGKLTSDVDLAIMNKGGLRRDLPKGTITQGEIIMMQPFDNRLVVLELKGEDLLDALDVMGRRGGDGLSRGMDVTFDPATGKTLSARLNGKPIDPDKTYRVATIDYLANGGDYMEPLTKGHRIARSNAVVYNDLIDYIKTSFKKKKINPEKTVRMYPSGK